MSGPERLADALLPAIRRWHAEHGPKLFVLGIAGAQGSGKSTLAKVLAKALARDGLRVAQLSLDDLYLTRAERQKLARDLHPLFATRGPPGTHDVALGLATIDALARGEAAPLPRFDKGRDDRAPEATWPTASAATQVLLFEGWCLGSPPQPGAALAEPVNALERVEDPAGDWRCHTNVVLGDDYARLWSRIDRLIFLAAPRWEEVAGWREQQEAELRAHAAGAMDAASVLRFIQHYERLTRWMLVAMPPIADSVIRLGDRRQIEGLEPLSQT